MLKIINKSSIEEIVKSVEDLTDTLKGLTKIIHEEKNKDKLPWNILMVKKIVDFELSVRALNCLKKENIVYVGDLVQKKEYELLKIKDFGRKSLREIKDLLEIMGLKLGVKLKQWDTDTISKALNLLKEDPNKDQIIKQVNLYKDLSKKMDDLGFKFNKMNEYLFGIDRSLYKISECVKEQGWTREKYFSFKS